MKRTRVLATAGLSLGLVMAMQSGCAQTAAVAKPTAQPETMPQAAAKPVDHSQPLSLSGKVLEITKAGGYTYVNLEKDGKSSWAAMSANVTAKVGEELTLKPGMVMNNFNSKALKRTFDSIVFTDGPINDPKAKPHNMVSEPKAAVEAVAAAAVSDKIAGKVVETMDSGGYTYLNLAKDGKTTWVAIPVTKVSVGQELEVQPGMPMDKFTSKTLNRTFDRINFSSGLITNAAATPITEGAAAKGSLPPGHPPLDAKPESEKGAPASAEAPKETKKKSGMMSAMSAQSGREMVAVSGKVVETMDAGGYSYLLVEQDGKKTWAAVPTTQLSVGQELKLEPGTEMKNFTSKKMNRTFETLIFSPGVKGTN
jgi:hypothetical protein